MSNSPGTVSKILWHFTGGPMWNSKTNRQETRLKSTADGYSALKSIIDTKTLRTGNYREVVRTTIPIKRIFNIEKDSFEIKKNFKTTIKSKPVCCIADIPIQHLSYHSKRYGKIAIGFHRDSVVRAGFNPVLYTLENSTLSASIYNSYSKISNFDIEWARIVLENAQSEIDDILTDYDIDRHVDTVDAIEGLKAYTSEMLSYYGNVLAYIKTFNKTDFESIYCEREWRSTNEFRFKTDDIAMIVLPKNGSTNYFEQFINTTKLPRPIPILSWEDLVEH